MNMHQNLSCISAFLNKQLVFVDVVAMAYIIRGKAVPINDNASLGATGFAIIFTHGISLPCIFISKARSKIR